MKYSEGTIGRVFVLRLEDGDHLPDTIETFAGAKNIRSGMCIFVGGINDGGKIVVGPEDGTKMPPVPMLFDLVGVHEVAAVGTIFSDADENPVLHMHAAMGRSGKTSTGCIRPGVDVWQIGEVIILEITDVNATRLKDPKTGFNLLEIQDN